MGKIGRKEALLLWIVSQKGERIPYRLRHKAGGLVMDHEQNPECQVVFAEQDVSRPPGWPPDGSIGGTVHSGWFRVLLCLLLRLRLGPWSRRGELGLAWQRTMSSLRRVSDSQCGS